MFIRTARTRTEPRTSGWICNQTEPTPSLTADPKNFSSTNQKINQLSYKGRSQCVKSEQIWCGVVARAWSALELTNQGRPKQKIMFYGNFSSNSPADFTRKLRLLCKGRNAPWTVLPTKTASFCADTMNLNIVSVELLTSLSLDEHVYWSCHVVVLEPESVHWWCGL